ncbi:hypothetical protein BGX31_001253 [Mortierella sp. GBA43]|nr:hypothetical protein BGX31_001253 [Mortierella sp. GBA43]
MEDVITTNANTAEAIARQNQTVMDEFLYLLEKSQQLFAGLRDLPPVGSKQWQPYYQKTFEIYSKLWRFQQQNRFVLENSYGLKRWEVGEIASKIGQLYYHYYLRTSETNYLHESYVFYEAIRDRRYFNDISEMKNPALMIKKLRYYARFTVVGMLLNNREVIASLKDELADLVKEYIAVFKPQDAAEWELVVQEISAFTDAEKKLHLVTSEGNYLPVAKRLQINKTISAALDKEGPSSTKLRLQEVILVGKREISPTKGATDNTPKETVPSAITSVVTSGTAGESSSSSANPQVKDERTEEGGQRRITEKAPKRSNPHKSLLYRPTLSQLMMYLATAFKELGNDSAMLVYMSADGLKRPAPDHVGAKGYHGGISTNARKATDHSDPEQQSISHCLHSGDLLPFTRKPMFLIVDSNNSVAFADMPRVFNHPFMSLMSPTEYPDSIPDTQPVGGLFTLFLHAPLLAFSFVCDIEHIGPETWEQCSALITQAECKIAELLGTAALDKSVRRFLQDEFLRQFIIRFSLCHTILKAHVAFTEPKNLPTSATCFEFEDPLVASQ